MASPAGNGPLYLATGTTAGPRTSDALSTRERACTRQKVVDPTRGGYLCLQNCRAQLAPPEPWPGKVDFQDVAFTVSWSLCATSQAGTASFDASPWRSLRRRFST